MAALFWISVAFVFYVYAGYPALIGVWATLASRFRPSTKSARPLRLRSGRDTHLPGVSIIVAARNEAARLPARVEKPPRFRLSRRSSADHHRVGWFVG
jgi:hypothetical protein